MNLDRQVNSKYYDRIDIAQLAVSILVFFLSLIWMGLLGLAAFGQVTTDYGATVAFEPGMVISLVLTGFVFLVISFVSVVTTIQKITGNAKTVRPSTNARLIWSIAELLVVFGFAALVGFVFPEVKAIAWAVLAVPGIAIPVFLLLRLGTRGQIPGNPKRNYGLLTFSVGVSTPFIVLVEILVFIIVLVVFVGGLLGKPEFSAFFNAIRNNPALLQSDPASLASEFGKLFNPSNLLGWLLLVVAGIMPLVEELFKTLGVWLLKVRNPDPAESMRAGLLCGGGFALFEGLLSVISLELSSVAFSEWVGLILGRFGGSLLHILTGGIIGLAIGKFWQNRKFGSLLLSYLVAWLLHASWNALAVFGGVNPLMHESQVQAFWPYVGLGILVVVMIFGFSRLLKNVGASEALSDEPTQIGD